MPLMTKSRLIAAIVAAVAVAGIGGTVLATRNAGATASAPPSSTPIPTGAMSPGKKGGNKGTKKTPVVTTGKITALTATSITVVDAGGKALTYTIAGATKFTDPAGQPSQLSALAVGEMVQVTGTTGRKPGKPKASPSPGASETAEPAATDTPVAGPAAATEIHDLGFKAS
jgi:hypothetical protein